MTIAVSNKNPKPTLTIGPVPPASGQQQDPRSKPRAEKTLREFFPDMDFDFSFAEIKLGGPKE